jgi:hypothetical protein
VLWTAPGPEHIIQLSSKSNTQQYALIAVTMDGKDRLPDDKWYELVRAKLKLQKRDEFDLESFHGIEVSGLDEGKVMLARMVAVGDTLFSAIVEAKQGVIDEVAAQRFFASLRLALPWRIYASPTTKFSVMVPAHAIEIDSNDGVKKDARRSVRGFFVGGRDALSYWASAQEIVERNAQVTDDQVLDYAIQSMEQDGDVITFQGPLEAGGMRGREFLSKKGTESFRGRMLVSEHFVYMLMVGAKSAAPLRDPQVSRFYDSLVRY